MVKLMVLEPNKPKKIALYRKARLRILPTLVFGNSS